MALIHRCDAAGSVQVAASPETVYRMVTDLAVLAELAEEATAMRWTKGSAARPGAVFRGSNRHGWRRWSTTCTVTAAEPGARFAFDVDFGPVPIARWEYEIDASDGGCRVHESVTDRRPSMFIPFAGLATGHQDRGAVNAANITATLGRLKARAEAS